VNLKLSIQKQKLSDSLITVRDLGLTISMKNNSCLVEEKHDDVFPVTSVILQVTYIYFSKICLIFTLEM